MAGLEGSKGSGSCIPPPFAGVGWETPVPPRRGEAMPGFAAIKKRISKARNCAIYAKYIVLL